MEFYVGGFDSFGIDVYDGASADAKRIWYLHSHQDFANLFVAETSSSDVLFVNYTSSSSHIDTVWKVELAYYLCGGIINNKSIIGSPIFSANHTYASPVQCTWVIKKPAYATFGFLQFPKLRVPYCNTLTVRTANGELLSVHRKNESNFPSKFNYQGFTNKSAEEKEARQSIDSDKLILQSNSTLRSLREVGICNNSIQGIIFNGSYVNVTYFLDQPEPKLGFLGLFQFLQIPVAKKPEVKKPSSFFANFGSLILFVPVGIAVGIIICYCQMKKCFAKSDPTARNNTVLVYVRSPKPILRKFNEPAQKIRGFTSSESAITLVQPVFAVDQSLQVKSSDSSLSDIEAELSTIKCNRNNGQITMMNNEQQQKLGNIYEDSETALLNGDPLFDEEQSETRKVKFEIE